MNFPAKKMAVPSNGANLGISDIRVAAVLVFVILNLAVFLIRVVSVWRYGALFAPESSMAIYPIWKAVHHLPVYDSPLQFPFTLALYNYLFYYTYAFFLRVVGAYGPGIMLWGRLLTPAFAILGAVAQWKLVQYRLHLRGVRSALSLIFALGLWFCASIVRYWAITMRPDMAAVALVMVALYMVVRQPRFGFAYAGVFFYLAWSFKQSVILAFVAVCLFLLFSKRWRDLSVLIAVFAALTAVTLLIGSPEYRYNTLVAPRLVGVFSLRWALQIAPKSLLANAYWILAPVALLMAAGARKVDKTVRMLTTVLIVALAGGLAAMTKTGAWDNYLLEAFVAGSTLLQIAVFTAPGRLISALLLFACMQPALQVATAPSGASQHAFGTVGIATAAEYADAVALRDRLATMKKPIFTTDQVFSLPWISNDNRAPALVIDTIFHDATRASCKNGCIEAMLQRGEIPTVMLPSATASNSTYASPGGHPVRPASARALPESKWAFMKINSLKNLLRGRQQMDLFYAGVRSNDIYRNSLSQNYEKVCEVRESDSMWSIYVLKPQVPSPNPATRPIAVETR